MKDNILISANEARHNVACKIESEAEEKLILINSKITKASNSGKNYVRVRLDIDNEDISDLISNTLTSYGYSFDSTTVMGDVREIRIDWN